MTVAVVAEKPSVARDIAAVLGADKKGEGWLYGNGYAVTWALGHLVRLAEPGEIDPAWRAWRWDLLPMLPEQWPLVVAEQTRRQFEAVRRVLHARTVDRIVCATDAGREGELIFRLVYEASGCRRPVDRLWISSLTPDAIRDGFARLADGHRYDRLADAARARSRADWLVGMNLSRAYSLAGGETLSIGRVQTPTLAMLVEREQAIRKFVPEDYLEVVATFEVPAAGADHAPPASPTPARFDATLTYVPAGADEATTRLPADGVAAEQSLARLRDGRSRVETVRTDERRMPPPLLYDLTELQRHAHRLYGMSAKHTLDVAQALYERHKLLSYPRTDSRHLSSDVAKTLPKIVDAVTGHYDAAALAAGTGSRPLGPRFVDDARVSDHHAIVPTTVEARLDRLSEDERRIYDLVCRRLLMAWHGPWITSTTHVVVAVREAGEGPLADRYDGSGTVLVDAGWKRLDVVVRAKSDEPLLPAGLEPGLGLAVHEARAVPKKTQPPPRFTEATLLTAMETAGRTLDDRELSDAMRDKGLGTPATRAAILETLLERSYAIRAGKSLQATDKGIALVDAVDAAVKSPAMTGEWEHKLARIERGALDLDAFMRDIARYVGEVVDGVRGRGGGAPQPSPPGRAPRGATPRAMDPSARSPRANGAAAAAPELVTTPIARRPVAPSEAADLGGLLHDRLGFAAFRPHQEDICRAVAAGNDALVVMPTGAGKSLCYQLPGLARGGTTVVVSPLIALIEDQVAKLTARGLAAERIHSGRAGGSAAVRKAYLAGELDFLFLAPERLAVPGFIEMLARRPPTLVAIDEAHCISHWGHDFRPEYRMLGARLPALRPAPIVALTATATPEVQDDIVEQLGLQSGGRFIHGFRRENIAVEAVELDQGSRPAAVATLLADGARRPAIVYVPTRKQAEQIAAELGRSLRAAPYHAGLPAAARERAQDQFLSGRLDVVVATIAFGMGVDKADVRTVVHTALPSSIEGYYQEIGRAGRDGEPARAVLLHAWSDVRTQQFFLERSYPQVEVLERLVDEMGTSGRLKDALFRRASAHLPDRLGETGGVRVEVDDDLLERALEQLWIHGGAAIDDDELVTRGRADWRRAYDAQRAHREAQLAAMARFPSGGSCRMLALVRHFGDREDSGAPCGICDVCAPDACLLARADAPSSGERMLLALVVGALSERDGLAVGTLARDVLPALDRRDVDRLLAGLARAGLVRTAEDEFVKDGRRIPFVRAWLTSAGREASESDLDAVVLSAPIASAAGARGRQLTKRRKAGGKRRGGVDLGTTHVVGGRRSAGARSGSGSGASKGRAGKGAKIPGERSSEIGEGRVDEGLVKALRVWRKSESAKRHVPAFRILTDRALLGIAQARPSDEGALLGVAGVGAFIVTRYGRQILEVVKATS